MRALVQGMEERVAWERYLHEEGEATDWRRVRSTIQWIRDTFAAAARREQRPGTARLILLDAGRVAQHAAAKLPSLEEFALARGLEDFSEDEQLEAYVAAYPARVGGSAGAASPVGGARRARLVERQLQALRWLENLVVHDPRPLDGVHAWLSPTLAMRLRSAGIHTLQELADTMNHHGARWWTRVPGVGQHKAARVADWLRAHAAQLKLAISEHAVVPRSQMASAARECVVAPATALRPLEKFVPPAHLDGHDGLNRERVYPCRISAADDRAAIDAWIAAKAPQVRAAAREGRALSATQRSYRKEAERLFLWAVLERGKALSSLDSQDMAAFCGFLAAPPAAWCGSRAHPRWSPQWRPLEGPLSPAAHHQAVVILHGLMAFLVRERYLVANPMRGQLRRKPGTASHAGE